MCSSGKISRVLLTGRDAKRAKSLVQMFDLYLWTYSGFLFRFVLLSLLWQHNASRNCKHIDQRGMIVRTKVAIWTDVMTSDGVFVSRINKLHISVLEKDLIRTAWPGSANEKTLWRAPSVLIYLNIDFVAVSRKAHVIILVWFWLPVYHLRRWGHNLPVLSFISDFLV